jgi:hypothetical protein
LIETVLLCTDESDASTAEKAALVNLQRRCRPGRVARPEEHCHRNGFRGNPGWFSLPLSKEADDAPAQDRAQPFDPAAGG